MEKVLYVLWRSPELSKDAFADQVCGPVAAKLLDCGARGVEVNVDDRDVSGSIMRIVTSDPPMSALVCVWLDAASDLARKPVDDVVNGVAHRVAAYLVTESEPLRNTAHPAIPGQRTFGVNNIAFLRRPADLDHPTWLRRWQTDHTSVAIHTQSSFGYVQNVVTRPLTADAPTWDGIVSELFPPAALTDIQAMFAASGDPARFQQNAAAMRASTARFGAETGLTVLPTSQYLIKSPFVS